MSQLSFGFEVPQGHVEPDVPRARPQSRKKPAASPVRSVPDNAAPAQDDAARMAQALQTHPDYKVLRRLVPKG